MSNRIVSARKSSVRMVVAAITLALTPMISHAQGFSGLFNTGVNGTGTPLAAGSVDSHYQTVENGFSQAFVVNNAAPYVFDANSRYIWQQADGQPTNVTRTFRTTFTIDAGYNPLTAVLNGRWSTDNTGLDILLNGASSGFSSGGFGAFTAFSFNTGFLAGLNTLDFVVNDFGVISSLAVTDLDGVAQLTVPTNVVPEPSAVALMGAGLTALGFVAHRRKRRA
ncbi:MAG: PEP-CTERM sorting domain-containing protein [Phycisphaerae bacterium]|nr:PEP-CTERM sorting domain-containing protein [Gemmatimonadaceae bacterium]